MYNPMGMSDVMVGQQNYLMGYEKSSGRTFMGPDNNLSKTYYQAWQNPQIIGREVDLASQYHTQENAMASYARAQADYIKQIADAQAYAQKVMSQASSYSRGGSSAYAQGGSAGASAYATSYNPYAQQSAGYANPYGQQPQMPYLNPYSGVGSYTGSGYGSPYSGGYYQPIGQGYNPYGQQCQPCYNGGLGQYGMNQIIGLLQQILQKISTPVQTQYIPLPINTPFPINMPIGQPTLPWGNNLPRVNTPNYDQILGGLKPIAQSPVQTTPDLNSLLPLLLNNLLSDPLGNNNIIRPTTGATTTGGGYADPWVIGRNIDFDRDGKNDTVGRKDRMSGNETGSFADLHFHGEVGKVYNLYNTTGGGGDDGLVLNAEMGAWPWSHAFIDTNGDGKAENIDVKAITGKDGTIFNKTKGFFYGHDVAMNSDGTGTVTLPNGEKKELKDGFSQSFKTNAVDANGNAKAGFIKYEKLQPKGDSSWQATAKTTINVGNMEIEQIAYDVTVDGKVHKMIDIVHKSLDGGTDTVKTADGKANNLTGAIGMLFGKHSSSKDIIDFLNQSIKDVDKKLSDVFVMNGLDDRTFKIFDTQKGLETIELKQGVNTGASGSSHA